MPKLKPTEQQARETAIRSAVARGMARKSLHSVGELADALDINPGTLYHYRAGNYQKMDFGKFSRMARYLGLTAEEVCAAVGVNYERKPML